MPSWKKLIVSGSNAILNQITASAGISTSAGLHVTSSNIEMHSDADTKLRIRRNSSTSALELSYRGSTGPLIHSVGKELDISTDTSGISLLPASGIVSINDNSTQGVKPGALSIQKISGINYLAIADNASSGAEGNIFLITGSNGNVGIANKDPQEKLDVTGNIQASGNISGSATSTGSFGQVDVAGKLQLNSSETGSTIFEVNGVNGRLFTITDEMSGSLFNISTTAGLPVIEALSRNYPDAVISLRYADEDFGHNCGEYTFQAGDLIEEYTPEGGSNEAHELAADIQGSPEWFLDRLYEIEAECADELEDYEINSIRYVYDKGVLDEFPKVVLEVMEHMAVEDENYEFAERIKNTIAVNEE